MRRVLHAGLDAHLQGFINPLQHTFARHLQGARGLAYGLAGMISPQNLRALDVAESRALRLTELVEVFFLLVGQNELRALGCSCHGPSIA
jgi:hypothetical protein